MNQKKQQDKTRILLVDDHPIVQQGLAKLINKESDLTVCGQAEDAPQALKAVKSFEPDMAIVDISLGDTSGLELIKDIRLQSPHLPILALSMHDETLYGERALRAGANGYIMKREAIKKIILAIHHVLDGQIYLSDKMSARMLRKLAGAKTKADTSPIDSLSDRELEVLLLIGRGHRAQQIAGKLYLSTKTIEAHCARIKKKLSLINAAELLQYAIQWAKTQQ